MRPKPTMTPDEEAQWQANQLMTKPVISMPKKKRLKRYNIQELWELFATWHSQHPGHRDGAEFLLWLERR